MATLIQHRLAGPQYKNARFVTIVDHAMSVEIRNFVTAKSIKNRSDALESQSKLGVGSALFNEIKAKHRYSYLASI